MYIQECVYVHSVVLYQGKRNAATSSLKKQGRLDNATGN